MGELGMLEETSVVFWAIHHEAGLHQPSEMLRVGLSRFSPLETKARGFQSPGGTQIIQVLDHFTLKQSW